MSSLLWFALANALILVGDAGTPSHRAPVLDVPGAFEEVRVPERLEAMGVPLRVRAVRTNRSPGALREHFLRVFQDAGLFIPESDELNLGRELAQVTGLDVETNTSYSAIFQPNLDGTTTVILGTAFLHARRPEPPAKDAFAPVYPGARDLLQLAASAENGRSLRYHAPASPDSVRAFYKEVLTKEGYRENAEGHYERAGSVLQLWIRPEENGASVVILQSGPLQQD